MRLRPGSDRTRTALGELTSLPRLLDGFEGRRKAGREGKEGPQECFPDKFMATPMIRVDNFNAVTFN